MLVTITLAWISLFRLHTCRAISSLDVVAAHRDHHGMWHRVWRKALAIQQHALNSKLLAPHSLFNPLGPFTCRHSSRRQTSTNENHCIEFNVYLYCYVFFSVAPLILLESSFLDNAIQGLLQPPLAIAIISLISYLNTITHHFNESEEAEACRTADTIRRLKITTFFCTQQSLVRKTYADCAQGKSAEDEYELRQALTSRNLSTQFRFRFTACWSGWNILNSRPV